MDNTLKAAYAALEQWKKNVTVKDFVRDNKRLNSSANLHSPTLTEFMQLSTAVHKRHVQIKTSEEKIDIFRLYETLFLNFNKGTFNYFIDNEKVVEQIISLNREINFQAVLSESISKDVVSILVKSRDQKVLFTRPQKKSLSSNDDINIKNLLAFDEKSIPRNRPHNSRADKILESYSSLQPCAAY